jgi:hypothetical protein
MAKIQYKNKRRGNKLSGVASGRTNGMRKFFVGFDRLQTWRNQDGTELMNSALRINPFLNEDLRQEMKAMSKMKSLLSADH